MTSTELSSSIIVTPTYAIFSDPGATLASTVNNVLAVSSSEAVSLGGKKAKTPIIAGSICGGLMGVAWIIGFAVYFRKRYLRKQRKRLLAQGIPLAPREKENKTPEEKVIIPPDPAVLLGQRKPGEYAFVKSSNLDEHEGKHRHKDHHSAHVSQSDISCRAGTAESGSGDNPVITSKVKVEVAMDALEASKGKHHSNGDHNV